MASSVFLVIYLSVGALFLQQIAQVIYNVFFSELRKIPGPWYAGITGIPKQYNAIIQRKQSRWSHEMHKTYGPYVRIAPDEVLIDDIVAFREVHRMGTPYLKTKIYQYLNPTPPGTPPYGLFQETDPIKHSNVRRMVARGFSLGYLRENWEATVHDRVKAAMKGMKEEAASNGGEVDVYKWWPLMAGDVISTLMFGECPYAIERGLDDELIAAYKLNDAGNGFAYSFPYIYHILKWLPIPSLKRAWAGNPVLIRQGQQAVKNSKGMSQKANIFAKVLAEAEKDDPTLSDFEIALNAGVLVFAGTDTTATSLTYLVWAVLSNSGLRRELEDEVAQLQIPYTDEKVESLPILNAVVKETLRLYGAAPAPLPRYVPREGALLGGYYFPAGTTVATQAWTLHRNPAVFENPDVFDHTRWLGDLASREDVKASWAPYGAGSRICIGMHLADMELRLATTAFFREFKGAELAASTTRESMEVDNTFLIEPHGGACKIILPTE
ncbi:hypothetical protein PRZ48_004246 [Zasmidium cellare]|uniref:Cytochrome P450 n=1 Tax=Zasmidium cellare TaxID=395010 RepID=A0ABR0E0P1_ZASCE|nr:hypothetical protein PRZ48_015302 [Zasmidium cellare]KAK4494997.1 hypothetical protein PRZ48_014353 [Zasmidium cellare]KAK4503331.1 hypothetical protein PRZ48_004246 [Zasmidium cellare]